MGSWGHSIRLLKREEIKHIWVGPNGSSIDKCAISKCNNKPEYVASYQYVTGKAGKVSKAEKFICREHAKKFALKYHIQFPNV